MDTSKSQSIKDYAHYNIAAPVALLSIGFVGPALSAAAAVGMYGFATWNDAKNSRAQGELIKKEESLSSLKDHQVDLVFAQKSVQLLDDLLKIKSEDLIAKDAKIVDLQGALDEEKQRVGRREKYILRLRRRLEGQGNFTEKVREEAGLAIEELKVRCAELEEKLRYALEHAAIPEQLSETGGDDDDEEDQLSEYSDDLPSQHEEVVFDETELALPEEPRVRADSGYNSETSAGQTPELIHVRPMVPVDWSRLLQQAETFAELDPDDMAMEYQDEDGPASIDGLSFEVLDSDKVKERVRGGSSLPVDRACQTHLEGLPAEAQLDFEQYREELRHYSLENHKANRAHMAQVFGEYPVRWAPKESTKLALQGSADDTFVNDDQVGSGNLSYTGNNANKPWNTADADGTAVFSEMLDCSRRGYKGPRPSTRVRERLVEEEESEDVLETLKRRLDKPYQVSAYPITPSWAAEGLPLYTPEAEFLHNGLLMFGQQVQPAIPQFPPWHSGPRLACAPACHPGRPLPSRIPPQIPALVHVLSPPRPLVSKMAPSAPKSRFFKEQAPRAWMLRP
ncbi:putative eukaryotic translation initiation factor 5 [Venturia inaequalis]|nr:putative eukaryotic translation initiation factor 5 [Venturia inaequalis]